MSAQPIEVLITQPFSDSLMDSLRAIAPRLRFTVFNKSRPEDIPPEVWQRTEVLYTSQILPTPEQAPQLRWIQFSYAGLDELADNPILLKDGVQVTTLSGAAAAQVAEYAVTMMLALGHRLPQLFNQQIKNEWPKDRWERHSPLELRGSTVGLVGYGSIGREIARLLQPFQATILAAKRNVMHPQDSGYIPEGLGDPEGNLFHRLYPVEAIKSMFKECDFVVVSLPLTDDTRDLIGAQELAAMRPTAYLIDVGRGGIIKHSTLVAVLHDKKIAGAALDVFHQEPLPKEDPLWKMPNVILTPHIAGISPHYQERAAALFAENLRRYLAGTSLLNRYDPEKGY
ncbi:MAG TPA: D-2-hydroxyacid dehydrogenase [Anaerolineaceae bacterium]|nr:D-2-hydroxyacid dehydrogenase [Anaerolineaceae bacterium]